PLKWSGEPADTKSFVLIVDDPDAPGGTFTHWVAYDVPASQHEIAEGASIAGKSGQNGAGRNGYVPPCPPSGMHRYVFAVYALDLPSLGLNEGTARDQVMGAIKDHTLAQGQLVGRYGR